MGLTGSPKEATAGTPTHMEDIPRDVPKDVPKDVLKDALRDVPKDVLKDGFWEKAQFGSLFSNFSKREMSAAREVHDFLDVLV